jgi:hypothetical protein
MDDREIEKEIERYNAPRFKNIGSGNLELREVDGKVIETIKPGEVVVGEKYRPFVRPAGPLKWLNKPRVDDRVTVISTGSKRG